MRNIQAENVKTDILYSIFIIFTALLLSQEGELMTTGQRLKYVREYYLKMNQEDFGHKVLGYNGNYCAQYISSIENGRRGKENYPGSLQANKRLH